MHNQLTDIQVFLPERHDTNNINSIVNNTFCKVDWLRHVLLYWPEHDLRVLLCKSLLLLSEVRISLSSLLYDLLKYVWEGRDVRLHNLLDITALSIIILPKAKVHLSSWVCSLQIPWPLPVAKVEPKSYIMPASIDFICCEFSFFKKITNRNDKKGCLPLWKYPSVGGGCKGNDIKSFVKLTIIIITFSSSHDTTLALPILRKGPEPTENLHVTFCPNWWSKTKKEETILVSQTTPSTFEQILNFYANSLHQNDVDFNLPFLS